MVMSDRPIYRRILLKLSGEALMGEGCQGIDPTILAQMVEEISAITKLGVQVAIVIGGGNYCRGASLAEAGVDRVTGDQIGMLATVMNAIAMRDALDQAGIAARAMSAFKISKVCDEYTTRDAIAALDNGEVVLFAAGTGNPFFTTDTAACLRGIEIKADVVMKATKVDGVYSADPVKEPDATLIKRISYDEVLERQLGVMDLTAIVLCREHNMPLRVFNMVRHGGLRGALMSEDEGTLVVSAS
ncbi:MAG: UMP kinase [Gammaproteobacteria bacterium]|uniref:Uridylate kinase n=1 Tax=Candidatus Thiopontia autotrophica TaxID=2841688 RepID=A0A8J6TQJ8_9GAMM|nr:UMP kinase [Candidatus Thiopontia autotrophica]MBL6969657.1 UMP kinase [Gammaproteobacteria bacterium]